MKKVLLALAVAAAVGSIAPATAQAQFGGLGKIGKLKGAVDKAKAAKDKADSAKAMIDAAKAVKGALTGAAAAMPAVTEESYAKFGKGLAAEKAALANKTEGEALLKAIQDASGLEYKDYNGLKTKIFSYYASSKKQDASLNLANEEETKILTGHAAEISTWVENGWPQAPEKK